jgi:hypothetical protein
MMAADPPRTIFLILAHEHPDLLARLVGRLQAPWSEVLVHIDRKVDQRPFAAATAGLPAGFVPQESRVDVSWGSISQVAAILRLLKLGLATPAERLCLLSGADYPVKPLAEIGRAFAGQTEFISVEREPDFHGTRVHDLFVRYPHFNHIKMLNPRSPKASQRLQHIVRKIARRFPRRPPKEPRLFHGSCWWALTRNAAESAVAYIDQRPEFIRWLTFANSPDEIIMQSVLKAGRFQGQIAHDWTRASGEPSEDNLYGCHYMDWSDVKASSPKILDLGDLPRIQASSALFARKIHPVQSRSLLDALDGIRAPAPATIP